MQARLLTRDGGVGVGTGGGGFWRPVGAREDLRKQRWGPRLESNCVQGSRKLRRAKREKTVCLERELEDQ